MTGVGLLGRLFGSAERTNDDPNWRCRKTKKQWSVDFGSVSYQQMSEQSKSGLEQK